MKRWVTISGFVIGGVLLLAAGFAGGAWTAGLSKQTWQKWIDQQLITEVAGGTNFRLEALSRMRLGEYDGAIEVLEMQVDTAVMSMPQGRAYEQMPEVMQRSMQYAKAYRSVCPSQDEAVMKQLEEVPMPAMDERCSPAIKRLVLGAKADSPNE